MPSAPEGPRGPSDVEHRSGRRPFHLSLDNLRERVGARRARAVGTFVMRLLQALEVEVQVAHRQVPASAPVVAGDYSERKAVRIEAVSSRSVTSKLPAIGRAASIALIGCSMSCQISSVICSLHSSRFVGSRQRETAAQSRSSVSLILAPWVWPAAQSASTARSRVGRLGSGGEWLRYERESAGRSNQEHLSPITAMTRTNYRMPRQPTLPCWRRDPPMRPPDMAVGAHRRSLLSVGGACTSVTAACRANPGSCSFRSTRPPPHPHGPFSRACRSGTARTALPTS